MLRVACPLEALPTPLFKHPSPLALLSRRALIAALPTTSAAHSACPTSSSSSDAASPEPGSVQCVVQSQSQSQSRRPLTARKAMVLAALDHQHARSSFLRLARAPSIRSRARHPSAPACSKMVWVRSRSHSAVTDPRAERARVRVRVRVAPIHVRAPGPFFQTKQE